MRKRKLIIRITLACIVISILMFNACGQHIDIEDNEGKVNNSTQTAFVIETPDVSSSSDNSTQKPTPTMLDINQHFFMSDDGGIFRYNLDGSGGKLIVQSEDIWFFGNIGSRVFYIGRGGTLFKTDINGQQTKLILEDGHYFIMIKESIYFVKNDKIMRLNSDETIGEVMMIPEEISNIFDGFETDGINLYLSTKDDESFTFNLYEFNIEEEKTLKVMENLQYDSYHVIKDEAVIYPDGNGIENQMLMAPFYTDEEKVLFEFKGAIHDVAIYKEWLIYITSFVGESDGQIHGFNLKTGEMFSLESQWLYINEVLSTQVNIHDSFGERGARLIISEGQGRIEVFEGN